MIDSELLQDRGRELALSLLSASRTLETHGPDNQAFRSALDRLCAAVSADLSDLGTSLRLDIIDRRLLIGGVRLRAFGTVLEQVEQLVDLLDRRFIGGLVFGAPLDSDTLRRWLATFIHEPRTEAAGAALRETLDAIAPDALRTLEPRTLTTPEQEDVVRVSTMAFAMQTYARVVLGHRDFVAALATGRDPYAQRLNVVRGVQDLVDVVSARADLLFHIVGRSTGVDLGCTYADVHAANSAIYALLMGHVLQLDRTALLDLGTSALLADALVRSDADGQRHDPDVAWATDERAAHRAAVARAVHAHRGPDGLDDALMIRTVVACERDLLGATAPHPYSRIVAVTDAYDALTQRRPWRDAYSPQHALRVLLADGEGRFDRHLLLALECVLTAYLGVTV